MSNNILSCQDLFKKAMAKFPTGVAITTTTHQNKPYGLTTSSFVSLSIDPLLVSVAIKNDSYICDIFKNTRVLNFNILTEDQQNISNDFATLSIDKRFDNICYSNSNTNGCPIINNSLFVFEAIKNNVVSAGDHSIFIAEVKNIVLSDDVRPLVYFDRGYYSLSSNS
ncbi:MAG TPA: flavin reductase family protein [Candidatus Megaira endosymbiont of Hartmannula sinica]|nr:flavin reductase family protein [Candidatus Megaera endosymbiont of Hartmannula sinica]